MNIDIDQCVKDILDIGHCILPNHFPRPAGGGQQSPGHGGVSGAHAGAEMGGRVDLARSHPLYEQI